MPKPKVSVRKECDSCEQQIPVACKTCPECGHELIPESRKEKESVDPGLGVQMSPEAAEIDAAGDPLERRRSVRAKRDKPDYYDVLDYDSKRQKTPKQGQKRGSFSSRVPPSQQVRRAIHYTYIQPTRATLSWKKTNLQDEDDPGKKKGKKPNGSKREESEENLEYMEDIPPEKVFACAVNLAEINRKLGVVMWKPN